MSTATTTGAEPTGSAETTGSARTTGGAPSALGGGGAERRQLRSQIGDRSVSSRVLLRLPRKVLATWGKFGTLRQQDNSSENTVTRGTWSLIRRDSFDRWSGSRAIAPSTDCRRSCRPAIPRFTAARRLSTCRVGRGLPNENAPAISGRHNNEPPPQQPASTYLRGEVRQPPLILLLLLCELLLCAPSFERRDTTVKVGEMLLLWRWLLLLWRRLLLLLPLRRLLW